MPSSPPQAWTKLPGWDDLRNQPSPAPYNLDDDFLPGDGTLLSNLPARPLPLRKPRKYTYNGVADSELDFWETDN